ncbi:MAG: PQQ-binding-like beta-propeller repeat protein [Lentisphaerae bacterium]|nr:PQQ-binding-like beta-propeller repeat protein [Lentisphaerota bacterium]
MHNRIRVLTPWRRAGGLLSAALLALSAHMVNAAPADRAMATVRQAGVHGGLTVHLGCGDGVFTAALRTNTSTMVHGLAVPPRDAETARTTVRRLGLYGPVSIERLRGQRLPYAGNLVNLLVADDMAGVPPAEAMRVLVPNGVLLVREGDGWRKSVKAWPETIDEWTHFMHGADNNAVARDTTIGPPERIQWAAGPRWSREHDTTPSLFAPVSARGRLFYVTEEGPVCVIDPRIPDRYSVVARDAFNGVVLWKRPIDTWYSTQVIWGHIPVHSQRRLVAVNDRVYVTPGMQAPVISLDARTGNLVHTYEGTKFTSEILCAGGKLVLAIRKEQATDGLAVGRDRKRFRRGFTGPATGDEAVMAVDAETGKILWREQRPCLPLTLTLANGRVLLADKESVTCLDAATGKQLWEAPCPARTIVVSGEIVVAATDRGTTQYSRAPKTIHVTALSITDGSQLWNASGDCLPNFNFFYLPVDLFVAQNQVWGLAEKLEWNKKPGSGHLLGLDLTTGKVTTRTPLAGAFTPGHHVRCYKGKATERFLLFNKRGIEFLNIESNDAPIQHQWIRGACRYGILPCNGLLYAPSHACACYPGAMLNGFVALSSAQNPPPSTPVTPAPSPLELGPAYGTHYVPPAEPAASEPDAWESYRHDSARSGATPTVVPSALSMLWKRDLGGKLTAPVAAAGRVLVAATDQHTLFCLNEADGATVWTFTAGGRIDSPPTIARNMVLFGSRDGACYCLNAADGELIWRFRAGPEDRRIGAFGQLESAWPVSGSVLVRDGVAYFAAGRSSFVDGGIIIYGLDIGSGLVRHRMDLVGPDPGDSTIQKSAGRMPGAVPDILSCDGESLYLRHVRLPLDLAGSLKPVELGWGLKSNSHLLAASGFLDDTLFNRTRWQYGNRMDRSQMLVFNGTQVYGLRVYSGISWNCSIHKTGEGYVIFKQDIGKPVPPPPKGKPKLLNRIPHERYTWHTTVPARVRAMVLTGARQQSPEGATAVPSSVLFVAGAPDEIDGDDPLAAFEGRKGARLLALSGTDGKTLSDTALGGLPVWDGMIAYRNKLFIAQTNGTILSLGKR